MIEFEQLVKVFFAENGTKADALATLRAAQEWARARCAESQAVSERYAEGEGLFPERLPELQLTSRFVTDFYLLVLDWARWAAAIVETWPDDPRQATPRPLGNRGNRRTRPAGGQRRPPRAGKTRHVKDRPRETTTAAADTTAARQAQASVSTAQRR